MHSVTSASTGPGFWYSSITWSTRTVSQMPRAVATMPSAPVIVPARAKPRRSAPARARRSPMIPRTTATMEAAAPSTPTKGNQARVRP